MKVDEKCRNESNDLKRKFCFNPPFSFSILVSSFNHKLANNVHVFILFHRCDMKWSSMVMFFWMEFSVWKWTRKVLGVVNLDIRTICPRIRLFRNKLLLSFLLYLLIYWIKVHLWSSDYMFLLVADPKTSFLCLNSKRVQGQWAISVPCSKQVLNFWPKSNIFCFEGTKWIFRYRLGTKSALTPKHDKE